ncbi:hypothetical protein [Streptomyces sp. NPDC088146]|uniref:hypothetical protein n=1 Tax=Streptomyces sp. NPDC088146 TaxID=3365829 RepID=UPI00381AD925
MIPWPVVDTGTGFAFDLANALAHGPNNGPDSAVDVTLWLDSQGKTWGDFGIDYDSVIDDLVSAQVPQFYLRRMQDARAIPCDASCEDMRSHYRNNDRGWPPYVQGIVGSDALCIR